MLRLGLTVAVVALLVRLIDAEAAWRILAGADLRYLLAVILLRPAIFFVRGWRFWHLAQITSGRRLPLGRVVGWHFVSINLGAFTPAGVGELSVAYFMRRQGVPAARTVAAMVLDKLITVAMISTMGLVGATLYLNLEPRWWLAAAAIFALGGLAAWILHRWLDSEHRWVKKGGKVTDMVRSALEVVTERPVAASANVGAAVVQSLLFTAQIWLCFRMLGAAAPFMGIFWITGFGRLANLLPITIGGLGVYEGSMVLLLENLGAGREVALAAVLVPRAITWLIAGAVACAVLWWRPPGEGGESSSAADETA